MRLTQMLIALAFASCTLAATPSPTQVDANTDTTPMALKSATEFAKIANKKTRSIALFEEAIKVITHPRCMNCHPATERPTQTDAMQPHQPLVIRSTDGHGAPAMRCQTCHHNQNYDPANVPGHPKWAVAPASMAWQGKTHAQICAQLKDPKRNGGMDHKELIHHMTEDSLVGWGWNPGPERQPAPGTQEEFGALIKAWLESGGHCPG